eukprot:2167046-Alexandrium_andersonii.AAC.1
MGGALCPRQGCPQRCRPRAPPSRRLFGAQAPRAGRAPGAKAPWSHRRRPRSRGSFHQGAGGQGGRGEYHPRTGRTADCLLYTSDAADDM